MPIGLLISLACHAALLFWAVFSMRAIDQLPPDETPSISAEIITPSEFLRLKQGADDAKKLETKAKDEQKPDESKNDTKKPDDQAPPPPKPQEIAKLEDPPPPEPPKVDPPPPEPPKPPEPDPIAKKIDEPPPPPEPAPGPTPDEQKLLEQKLEEDRKKAEEEAKKKAEEDAKKKAEEEAKKKAAEELKKKKEEERKKKLAEAKKKAEEEKKKFDANKIAELLNQAPDDGDKQKALLDKDPKKKGQQASGTSQTAEVTGKEAGVANGHDVVLSAREQDLLAGQIKSQLARCSKMPGGGGGTDTPIVTVQWNLRPDGSLDGEPQVLNPQGSPLFRIAAEASVNAVKNCSPLNLPADKYEGWKKITWDFDWPAILGLR